MLDSMPFSLLIISLLCIQSIQQSVSYGFQILKRNREFESHIYLSFLSKDDFCLGTPYQCEKVVFDPGVSLPVILNREENLRNSTEGNYRKSLSSSYRKQKTKISKNSIQKMISGEPSYETVSFGSFKMEGWPFFLADHWVHELHYSCIGLAINRLNETKYHYFINKLHENDFIAIRQYSIELIDEENGTITFGDIYLKPNYTKLFRLNDYSTYYVTRFYAVREIRLGQSDRLSTSTRINVHLDESFGFVQMPGSMMEQIQGYYLNEEKCKENIYNSPSRVALKINYSYFLCSKSILDNYIKDNLHFDLYDGIISLRKEDLFIDYDSDYFIFAVIFKNDREDPQWVIGEPVLKRYFLIKNYVDNTITFYEKTDGIVATYNHLAPFVLLVASALLTIGCGLIGYAFINKAKDLQLFLS